MSAGERRSSTPRQRRAVVLAGLLGACAAAPPTPIPTRGSAVDAGTQPTTGGAADAGALDPRVPGGPGGRTPSAQVDEAALPY
ncbi:MAG TPA: hypothetical protein PK141_13205, partial [Polyangiaceae bacterium]|nr:hypothetical protein [Polyangiaceae bacterium]